jgi:hypothetical protein
VVRRQVTKCARGAMCDSLTNLANLFGVCLRQTTTPNRKVLTEDVDWSSIDKTMSSDDAITWWLYNRYTRQQSIVEPTTGNQPTNGKVPSTRIINTNEQDTHTHTHTHTHTRRERERKEERNEHVRARVYLLLINSKVCASMFNKHVVLTE